MIHRNFFKGYLSKLSYNFGVEFHKIYRNCLLHFQYAWK